MTTANILSQLGSPGVSTGFKNRIINGAMVISQRYGTTATANTISDYTVDRFAVFQSVTGKVIAQQNAGSVTLPAGFTNYLGITSQSAYSIGSSDYYYMQQPIEGYNVADLGWGTASAKTVTLSFQVYSSLTGTFGGSLRNNGASRSYPFTYSVPVANTWTQISVTIAGDTSGTWLTNNGIGINVGFSLGTGATYSGTAGSWAGANYVSATGATSVVGTNGATFYITGVQLEVGVTATGFDYRPYGTELALCQRYYEILDYIIYGPIYTLAGYAGQAWQFKVSKRASPTMVYGASTTGTQNNIGTSGVTLLNLANSTVSINPGTTASAEL